MSVNDFEVRNDFYKLLKYGQKTQVTTSAGAGGNLVFDWVTSKVDTFFKKTPLFANATILPLPQDGLRLPATIQRTSFTINLNEDTTNPSNNASFFQVEFNPFEFIVNIPVSNPLLEYGGDNLIDYVVNEAKQLKKTYILQRIFTVATGACNPLYSYITGPTASTKRYVAKTATNLTENDLYTNLHSAMSPFDDKEDMLFISTREVDNGLRNADSIIQQGTNNVGGAPIFASNSKGSLYPLGIELFENNFLPTTDQASNRISESSGLPVTTGTKKFIFLVNTRRVYFAQSPIMVDVSPGADFKKNVTNIRFRQRLAWSYRRHTNASSPTDCSINAMVID